MIPLSSATAILGLKWQTSIVHILEVGDLTCRRPVFPRDHSWPKPDELHQIGFSWEDILAMHHEIHVRRRFFYFRAEYADVFLPEDDLPGGRGLEFSPGWEGILREFCDGLRELHRQGKRYYLRWGKEKFGAMRLFHTRNPDPESGDDEAVGRLRGIAYRRSLQTCQECGEPGRLRMGISVCLTLCERHKHLVYPLNEEQDGVILDLDAHYRAMD
ncbi:MULTISPECIES: hypothetical protein [unclassified Ensifer]|uniref:hypothetical protein n=1 Tax=unclassified Ensifer TaxID=2633371 RepID=UPI00081330AD|nr:MULTISPECIES: hypothetical protein [unclassified Ensifer]OCP11522.1 hypothetical protein BBX50_18010 [Ensifer sp. LC11]